MFPLRHAADAGMLVHQLGSGVMHCFGSSPSTAIPRSVTSASGETAPVLPTPVTAGSDPLGRNSAPTLIAGNRPRGSEVNSSRSTRSSTEPAGGLEARDELLEGDPRLRLQVARVLDRAVAIEGRLPGEEDEIADLDRRRHRVVAQPGSSVTCSWSCSSLTSRVGKLP